MLGMIKTSPDVVIVGGGPIGLWTGIQARLLSGKNVLVLERNETYQRSNIRLRINASSLGGIPPNVDLETLAKKWGDRIVPIKEMEEDLTVLADKVGVEILKGYRADPEKLPDLFPNAKLFIGADGARSSVRQAIFQDQFRFHSNLQYMAQVQYIVKPKVRDVLPSKIESIKDLSTSYKMQKFAEHWITEQIHPQTDGSSRVTLQIFIDEATYSQISDAKFGNPYYFKTHMTKLPASLRELLIRWWGAQKELQGQEILPDDKMNQLTVVALNSYAANEVVTVDAKGRLWTLVGDAAAGFPFFRAINNGFKLGTKLAQCIAEGFQKDSLESYLTSYSRYTTFRVWVERIRASITSFFITLTGLWLQVSNRVPWQSVKLLPSEKQQIHDRGMKIWNQLAGFSLEEKGIP
jgi:2-polyprenyl-6-methoxyphenol hydroxylase-like FAD-dependent oxidoreductase